MQANGTGTTGSGVQEFQLEYASMLSDLTFNSKPMINSLTMVAEENKGLAEVIVNLVERRIAEAPDGMKLCAMYLMDSIVKNVGEPYLSRFARHLVSVFGGFYGKASDAEKGSLKRLLSTWKPYFPRQCAALEAIIRSSSVPTKTAPHTSSSPALHVHHQAPHYPHVCVAGQSASLPRSHGPIECGKARALTHKQVAPHHHGAAPAYPYPGSYHAGAPPGYPPYGAHAGIPYAPHGHPYPSYPHHPHYSPHPVPGAPAQPHTQLPLPHTTFPATAAAPAPPPSANPHGGAGESSKKRAVGAAKFGDVDLREARHNPAVVESLYGDFKHQCPNCARRFHERDDMDQHMDWHFRMNKKEKEKQKQSVSRGWYLTADQWCQYTGPEAHVPTVSITKCNQLSAPMHETPFGNAEFNLRRSAEGLMQMVVAADDSNEACHVCGEKFDTRFDDEEDEWFFVNAVRAGDAIVHVECVGADAAKGNENGPVATKPSTTTPTANAHVNVGVKRPRDGSPDEDDAGDANKRQCT